MLFAGWFFQTMRRADTPIDPREPVARLVTTGPFRYTGNPAYLSMAMIFTGLASRANALCCMLLLPAVPLVMQRGVIEREEIPGPMRRERSRGVGPGG